LRLAELHPSALALAFERVCGSEQIPRPNWEFNPQNRELNRA
jgi:hypothetical protein